MRNGGSSPDECLSGLAAWLKVHPLVAGAVLYEERRLIAGQVIDRARGVGLVRAVNGGTIEETCDDSPNPLADFRVAFGFRTQVGGTEPVHYGEDPVQP